MPGLRVLLFLVRSHIYPCILYKTLGNSSSVESLPLKKVYKCLRPTLSVLDLDFSHKNDVTSHYKRGLIMCTYFGRSMNESESYLHLFCLNQVRIYFRVRKLGLNLCYGGLSNEHFATLLNFLLN